MSTGYLFPEIPTSGGRTSKRLVKPLSVKTMATRFKEHLGHAGMGTWQFTFHSFRVGCTVTQTIAGKDIVGIIAAVSRKSESIARRYVGGVTTTRYPTGTTPGAKEARYGAANALLMASVDSVVWALFLSRSAPPRGVPQPPTACATSF